MSPAQGANLLAAFLLGEILNKFSIFWDDIPLLMCCSGIMKNSYDAIVIGAGHNGLVAGIRLQQKGVRSIILEQKDVVGGAVRTEEVFPNVPGLKTSTGAYLLGLMPPELTDELGVKIPTIRRDPHYFLPTTDGRYLLFGSDEDATRDQFHKFFSAQDWQAHCRLQDEIEIIREDIAPTWMQSPLSVEQTADKFVRDELKDHFIQLCRGTVGDYLERFEFKSDLLKAMYAVTDGFSGLNGGWDTPGTGMNFLVHNMCRRKGSDGTWQIVRGGMGEITKRLAKRYLELGGEIKLGVKIEEIEVESGVAKGVNCSIEHPTPPVGLHPSTLSCEGRGETYFASSIFCNADPFVMQRLIGRDKLPRGYNERIDSYLKDGTTLKVNFALKDLPTFTCLPENKGQFGPTIHLLPDESEVMAKMKEGFADVQAGKLPEFPTIEWYLHTTLDPSLQDAKGHHNAALFVQWVPYEIKGSSWEKEKDAYTKHLLEICNRFAPNTTDLVVDTFTLAPPDIEDYFGITRGHIHHVDNAFGFDDRLPYETPVQGLYSCSAGTHPAGSVIGCAGYNAVEAMG